MEYEWSGWEGRGEEKETFMQQILNYAIFLFTAMNFITGKKSMNNITLLHIYPC
jgi:hypothetical protein